jgi:hypothetical protein
VEAQAKAAEATDPAAKAGFEKQAKQWEARLKEEESRNASQGTEGGRAMPNLALERATMGANTTRFWTRLVTFRDTLCCRTRRPARPMTSLAGKPSELAIERPAILDRKAP